MFVINIIKTVLRIVYYTCSRKQKKKTQHSLNVCVLTATAARIHLYLSQMYANKLRLNKKKELTETKKTHDK